MLASPNLWRTARWPLLVIVIALLGIVTANVLDQTVYREWALTIGAPSIWFVLPIGVVWLAALLIDHLRHRRTVRGAPGWVGWGAGRPGPGAHDPARLPGPGGLLHVVPRVRKTLAQHGKQRAGAATRAAVHGGQHGDLGLPAVTVEGVGG